MTVMLPMASRYKKMETCITLLPEVNSDEKVAGGVIKKWPERAFAVPPRITMGTIPGINTQKFEEDNTMWNERITHYKWIVPGLTQIPERDGHECQLGWVCCSSD